MGPGQTALTVIPCGARSSADACVSPMTANLLAEYAAPPALACLPALLAMLTMRPPLPSLAISRPAYLVTRNTAVVLIARKCCHTTSSSSVTGTLSRPMMARALFTTMSSRP